MKKILLSVMALVALAACSEKQNRSFELHDSSAVADARAKTLVGLEHARQKRLSALQGDLDTPESRSSINEMFDSLAAKARTTPAATVPDLQNTLKQETLIQAQRHSKVMTAQHSTSVTWRTRTKHPPGEKRAAVNAEGFCTKDIIVDTEEFETEAKKIVPRIPALLLNSSPASREELKTVSTEMLMWCDEIVDRYGATATCERQDNGHVIRMSEFRDRCNDARRQLAPRL